MSEQLTDDKAIGIALAWVFAPGTAPRREAELVAAHLARAITAERKAREAAEAKLARAVKLLKKREFVEPNMGDGAEWDMCPDCAGKDFNGHNEKCPYALALSEIEKEAK